MYGRMCLFLGGKKTNTTLEKKALPLYYSDSEEQIK